MPFILCDFYLRGIKLHRVHQSAAYRGKCLMSIIRRIVKCAINSHTRCLKMVAPLVFLQHIFNYCYYLNKRMLKK